MHNSDNASSHSIHGVGFITKLYFVILQHLKNQWPWISLRDHWSHTFWRQSKARVRLYIGHFRPVESHSGARPGNHYRRALSQPHSIRRHRDRDVGRPGGASPVRSPGRSPGRKWILCIFQVIKKPSGFWNAIFSIFDRRPPPQMSRASGKLPPPLSPSRRTWAIYSNFCSVFNRFGYIAGFIRPDPTV